MIVAFYDTRTDLPDGRRATHGTRARYVSGCRCEKCSTANRGYALHREIEKRHGRGNPLVYADRARRHLQKLRQASIGRRTVAKQSGVSVSVILAIIRGRKLQIRKSTETRLLLVPLTVQAPHALVPAGPTWTRIQALLRRGWRKVWIAKALQQSGMGLQLGRTQITARNERKVLDLYFREQLRIFRSPPVLWRGN